MSDDGTLKAPDSTVRKVGTPSAERKRNAELRRKAEQERRKAEQLEKQRKLDEEKRLMKEKIRKRKEEAARKKAEAEALAAEKKAEEEAVRKEQEEKLRLSKLKAKEEAARIREEQEREEAEKRAAAEAERVAQEQKIALSRQKAKEEAERIKAEAEEKARAEKEAAEAATRNQLEAIRRVRAESVSAREAADQARAAKKAAEEEANRLAQEKHLAQIAKAKAEAKKKKEEEMQAKLAAERLKKEEEQAVLSARAKRRKEELARTRKEQEEREAARKAEQEAEKQKFIEERRAAKARREKELEEQRRREAEEEEERRRRVEEEKKEREEQARLAVLKHAEEAKRLREQERDLEEEEQKRLEEERARAFEEEQKKRQAELDQFIRQEEERQQEVAEKMKELAAKGEKLVVNRCGLFRVFGEEPGLEIWSVGDEQISKIPQLKHHLRGVIGESHGSFLVAKCYILLFTEFSKGRRHFHIHSWIGSKSDDYSREQAEKRLKELEDGLQLEDVQEVHREKEGEESDQFKGYFPQGVEYVQPVVLRETEGPNVVDKSLFQIKGRKNVHALRVPVHPDSINSGDVFVLEDQKIIFQWNGKKANKMEKGKSLDVTIQMRIERNARARVVIIEEGEESHEARLFWEALTSDAKGEGGSRDILAAKPVADGGDDEEHEQQVVSRFKFHSFGNGSIEADEAADEIPHVVLVEGAEPNVELLAPQMCFVLDCFSEVYVWIGKETCQKTRDAATRFAESTGKGEGRPPWAATPVIVKQQCEIVLFKEKFIGNWGEYADFDFTRDAIQGNIAQLEQKEINIDKMHYPAKYALAKEEMKDLIPPKSFHDKTDLEVWLVTEHDKEDVPVSEHGIFFSEHCYIVLFTVFLEGGDSRTAIYHWQGRHSSREDKGTSALIAGEIGNKMSFSTVNRVMQGKETNRFLGHFSSPVIVLNGQITSREDFGKRLLSVRGNTVDDAYAIETDFAGKRLHSNDAVVVLNGANTHVWHGAGSNAAEQENASKVAQRLSEAADVPVHKEGSEDGALWSVLGGKPEEYSNAEHFKAADQVSVRLFHCSNRIGIFEVYEIEENPTQDDLSPSDCIIIDGMGREVFVWNGSDANEKCKEMARETAQQYVDFSSEEHKKWEGVPVTVVESGAEPLSLTAYFHGWDMLLQEAHRDPYAHRLRVLKKAQERKQR